jgi:hypothetical protein
MPSKSFYVDADSIETVAESYINGNLSDVAAYLDAATPQEAAWAGLAIYLNLSRFSATDPDAEAFARWIEGRNY